MSQKYTLERPSAETPKIYEQDGQTSKDDLVVYEHYFISGTSADWFVIEYDRELDEIFCFAELIPGFGELGYTSMKELDDLVVQIPVVMGNETIRVPLQVEKEICWTPKRLGEVLEAR